MYRKEIDRQSEMGELSVRLVQLPPMRVARFLAYGKEPEARAWTKLREWAQPKGLLEDVQRYPVFGFNNPSPIPERPEYGYEFWIRIGFEQEVEGSVAAYDFPGGWYAAAPRNGFPNAAVWMTLYAWVRASRYRYRRTHELERPWHVSTEKLKEGFDLYLPIEAPVGSRAVSPI